MLKKVLIGGIIVVIVLILLGRKDEVKGDNEYFDKGYTCLEQGKYSEAISMLEKAIKVNPNNGKALGCLAFAYRESSEFKKAIAILEKMDNMKLSEELRVAIPAELGFCYYSIGAYDKAIPFLQEAVRLDNEDADSFCNLGLCYNEKKEYDKAISYLQKALRLSSDMPVVYCGLGFAYAGKSMKPEAIQNLKEALRLDPELYEAKGLLNKLK